jgi:adenylylsulfate kinase
MKHSNTTDPNCKTIWLTGLSGAGKTTLAKKLQKYFDAVLVDGDDLRNGITKELSFDNESRMKNVTTAAHICKMVNDSGHTAIAAMMSPLNEHREEAKNILGSIFIVYVSCDIQTLKQRDTKGLYEKFDNGVIKNMVGMDLPFEVPSNANIVVNTAHMTLKQCRDYVIESYLRYIGTYHTKSNI